MRRPSSATLFGGLDCFYGAETTAQIVTFVAQQLPRPPAQPQRSGMA